MIWGENPIFGNIHLRKSTDFDYLGIGQLLGIGGGNSHVFVIFTRKLGEDGPNLTSRFFRWVETTN